MDAASPAPGQPSTPQSDTFSEIGDWLMANKLLAVILVAGLSWGVSSFMKNMRPADTSHVSLTAGENNTLTSDPCAQKSKCLAVVVAPWCPVCNGSMPLIKLIRDGSQNSPRYGMKIVVAADSPAALRDEARAIGDNAYIDENSQFVRAAQIHGYPTWVVLDENHRVVSRFAGGFYESNDAVRYAVLSKLGISS